MFPDNQLIFSKGKSSQCYLLNKIVNKTIYGMSGLQVTLSFDLLLKHLTSFINKVTSCDECKQYNLKHTVTGF